MANINGPNWATYVIMALVVIGLIGGAVYMNGISKKADAAAKSAADAKSSVDAAKASIPSASQIASQIVIPPSAGGSSSDEDVLAGVYPGKVSQLQNDCVHALQDEYSTSKVYNKIQDLIEGNLGEEIKDLVITDWNYNNEYKFKALDLGLDDENTRSAQISDTMRVSYRLVDGNTDLQRDRVYVVATCSNWDKRQDVFDTAVATLSL